MRTRTHGLEEGIAGAKDLPQDTVITFGEGLGAIRLQANPDRALNISAPDGYLLIEPRGTNSIDVAATQGIKQIGVKA